MFLNALKFVSYDMLCICYTFYMLQLALLRKIAKRKSDLCLYADELGKGLVGELDYTREAANATEFMVLKG